jgi:hypothetical protein
MRIQSCSIVIVVLAAAMVSGATAQPPQPRPQFGAPLAVDVRRTAPTPFQFEIEELSLRLGDRAVLRDNFRLSSLRPTEMEGKPMTRAQSPRYRVELGKISDSNVRNGVLRVNQASTTNIWLGPGGTFGHRLHHHDVFIALMTVPIDTNGRTTFIAKEGFPLDFTVRVRRPRLQAFEKIKIGLLEQESFKNVAAVALGRVPTPFPPIVAGGGGGGGTKRINLLDLVSNPAIVLNRVEEPDVLGEIVLDHAPLQSVADANTIELSLRVGPQGELAGGARVVTGGLGADQVQEFKLAPRDQEPREFYSRRMRLSPDTRLSATIYIETLPKPTIFRSTPNAARAGGRVDIRVEGIGFGPDTRAELVPQSGRATAIKATTTELERQSGAPEGAVLLTGFDNVAAGTYSIRVTTGGQIASIRNALKVS